MHAVVGGELEPLDFAYCAACRSEGIPAEKIKKSSDDLTGILVATHVGPNRVDLSV
jgi:hypothetical protein